MSGLCSAQSTIKESFAEDGQLEELWQELSEDYVQWISFYPNGSLREVGHWYQGQMHGPWSMWAENGQKIGDATYRYGQKSGCWRVWALNGEWLYDLWYENGRLLKSRSSELASR